MSTTTLYIKNMVCPRCIEAIQEIFKKENLTINSIELGKVVVNNKIQLSTLSRLKDILITRGFELIQNKNQKIIEQIKTEIIEIMHHDKSIDGYLNLSKHISLKLDYEYSYLSSIFSNETGSTIEKFIIAQRIERVKELLDYNELSLKEISYKLGYSSVQHLSYQFKKVAGITPTNYKKIDKNKRKSLDKL